MQGTSAALTASVNCTRMHHTPTCPPTTHPSNTPLRSCGPGPTTKSSKLANTTAHAPSSRNTCHGLQCMHHMHQHIRRPQLLSAVPLLLQARSSYRNPLKAKETQQASHPHAVKPTTQTSILVHAPLTAQNPSTCERQKNTLHTQVPVHGRTQCKSAVCVCALSCVPCIHACSACTHTQLNARHVGRATHQNTWVCSCHPCQSQHHLTVPAPALPQNPLRLSTLVESRGRAPGLTTSRPLETYTLTYDKLFNKQQAHTSKHTNTHKNCHRQRGPKHNAAHWRPKHNAAHWYTQTRPQLFVYICTP